MDKTVNKFLLAGDKFMHEIHLRQPGLIYSACGPFTKNKERIKKFKDTEDWRYIYWNELNKVCFHNDLTYVDSRDLLRKTAFDKLSEDKAFNIAKNLKYDEYQRGFAKKSYGTNTWS